MIHVTTIALLALTAQAATYSNVCMSRETGDLGGVELTLSGQGETPGAILKTCEGGCWRPAIRDLKIADGKVTFLAIDQTFTAEGAVAETTARRFTGVFQGRGLVLDSPGLYGRQVLKRIPVPPNLNDREVKGSSSSWPMPIRRCG